MTKKQKYYLHILSDIHWIGEYIDNDMAGDEFESVKEFVVEEIIKKIKE